MTINWWHIAEQRPDEDDLEAARPTSTWPPIPNVKIKITVLENEAFKAKLTTNMQAGKPPDIFQSWGGGTLKEQADAGLVKDITEPDQVLDRRPQRRRASGSTRSTASSTGSRTTSGMVGVWYNKKLFEKAGIDAPPATWNEFLARRPEAEVGRHHADRRRREGQVARDVLVGEPVAAHRRQGRDGQGRRRTASFDAARLRQGRRASSRSSST